jgi:hypothetical protein
MSNQPSREEIILEKLRTLPTEQMAEVEDFIDFLHQRYEERSLSRAASKLSESSFQRVWDNPEDSVYDQL